MMPGKHSSEYAKALRVELAGLAVLALGLALAVLGALDGLEVQAATGAALAAVGAYVLVGSLSAYARSRGEVKASAVRRPADQARRL